MNRCKNPVIRREGFTLIELLVVIAIIGLLLAVIVPSLNMAKKKAAAAVCLSSNRQISLAWYMYQEENSGHLVYARMQSVGNNNSCKEGWVGQPFTSTDATSSSLTLAQTSPAVTDEDEIRGIMKGKLFPYLDNPNVYHCPADKLRKGPDNTKLYLSYSIPLCMYGFNNPSDDWYTYQNRKLGQITSPGTKYMLVESGERSRGNWIYGGYFIMATPEYGFNEYGLWEPLAISHGNSAVFGFADGHAESYKWHDSIVLDHYWKTEGQAPGTLYGQTFTPSGGSDDLDWLTRGWGYKGR